MEGGTEWNVKLIQSIFWEEETKAMLSIPVGQILREDKLIWAMIDKGLFTVKSAYFFALNLKGESRGAPSNIEARTRKWKFFWDLSVPTKVKNFLWRITYNSLPTKNLFKSRVVDNMLCPLCHQEPESAIHLAWNCCAANDIWAMSPLHP